MAEARERAAWQRTAVLAAVWGGGSIESYLPERYRDPPAPPEPVAADSNRRGWAVIFGGFMAPPASWD